MQSYAHSFIYGDSWSTGCVNIFIAATHHYAGARNGEYLHRWILLWRVAVELPPAPIPFHRVQTVPFRVVKAIQNDTVQLPNGRRNDDLDVPQSIDNCKMKLKIALKLNPQIYRFRKESFQMTLN